MALLKVCQAFSVIKERKVPHSTLILASLHLARIGGTEIFYASFSLGFQQDLILIPNEYKPYIVKQLLLKDSVVFFFERGENNITLIL